LFPSGGWAPSLVSAADSEAGERFDDALHADYIRQSQIDAPPGAPARSPKFTVDTHGHRL